MKDEKPLALTREGPAPPFRGPRRPRERAAEATCGGVPTLRGPPPPPNPGHAQKFVPFLPRAAPGPALECAGKVRGAGRGGGGGEVVGPRDQGLLRCPPNSGALRSCLLITTTKNHKRAPSFSPWAALRFFGAAKESRRGWGGWGGERVERRQRDKKGVWEGGRKSRVRELDRDEGAKGKGVKRGEKSAAGGELERGARRRWGGGPRPAAPRPRPGHLAVAVVPQTLREVQAGGVPGRRGVEPHIHAGAGPGAGGRD